MQGAITRYFLPEKEKYASKKATDIPELKLIALLKLNGVIINLIYGFN
ncbi:hypothetical protein pah_c032o045 [Parachlamydia acanthamoebae str. Hall's coccus]|nr:hypothetical protein pah_c032o045 [Parachlamydia acanthamoebae str. Hall's coccus]